MPSSSTFNSAEKAVIKRIVPTSDNKIFAAAIARIYYAFPSPNESVVRSKVAASCRSAHHAGA